MISTKNKRRNKILFLVILLLALSIGFAALSTTLKINGTANIGKNSWNVYWDTIANKQGVTPKSGPTIGNDSQGGVNTQVNFEVDLNTPGDYFEFTVNAVNAGTLDAMITSIDQTLNGNPVTEQNKLPDYIKFNVTYIDGVAIGINHLLPKATVSGNTSTPTVETYKVRIEYDRDAVTNLNLPANDTTYQLTYSITYSQADSNAIDTHTWMLPTGKNKDNLELGDEICIRNQCFNFVRYDENDDVVLLAKWNLNVGTKPKGEETFIQDSDVRGWMDSSTGMTKYGAVNFSYSNYWADGETIKDEYKNNTPQWYIYDPVNHTTPPDFNTYGDSYSIAYYVNIYKDILESAPYAVQIKVARLLTYQEATDDSIGCTSAARNHTCPTTGTAAFITNTSYWLGTYLAYDKVCYVLSDGTYFSRAIPGPGESFVPASRYYLGSDGGNRLFGVRPVIVVEKSNL